LFRTLHLKQILRFRISQLAQLLMSDASFPLKNAHFSDLSLFNPKFENVSLVLDR